MFNFCALRYPFGTAALFARALLHEPDLAEWTGIALIGTALLSLNFARRTPAKVCNHP